MGRMNIATISFRDRIIELRRVPARELIPNPKNWRRHPERQAAALRGVLEEVGYADALLARETPEGLMLIDGHLRAETTPEQPVPVLVLDVDEAEADKLLATLDPLAGMAEMDKMAFKNLAVTINTESTDVRELLNGMAGIAPEVRQDAIPVVSETPTARVGQLWRLGGHRILCGDSTRPEHIARLMGNERAVLFQTDPPYGIGYTGAEGVVPRNRRGQRMRKDWSALYRDVAARPEVGNSEADAREFYVKFIRAAIEGAITPDAAWYCWHGSKRQAMLESVWQEFDVLVHDQIIWSKGHGHLTFSVYLWAHEPCFFGWVKGNKPYIAPNFGADEGGFPTTVWEVPVGEAESKDHPTCKPNRIFAIPMRMHTRPGDLCYEPFSGSGSQLIAAEQLGRRCYAIEVEPRFVDVAIARWEKLTGQKAELIAEDDEDEARTTTDANQAQGTAGEPGQASNEPAGASATAVDTKLP